MKQELKHASIFALISCAGLTAANTPTKIMDVSGSWQFEVKFDNGGGTPACLFQQTGSQLSAACKGPNSSGPAMGTVNGQNVEFAMDMTATTPRSYPGRFIYKGSIGPKGEMAGTVITPDGNTGTFRAVRR